MTRIPTSFEGTATFKVCKKLFFGEITDYPQRIGKWALLSTDGITAVYVDKKGVEEEVKITSNLTPTWMQTVQVMKETGEYEEKHPLLPFLAWEPGKRNKIAVNNEIRRQYREACEDAQAKRREE